jgi:hypothetical protein
MLAEKTPERTDIVLLAEPVRQMVASRAIGTKQLSRRLARGKICATAAPAVSMSAAPAVSTTAGSAANHLIYKIFTSPRPSFDMADIRSPFLNYSADGANPYSPGSACLSNRP